MTIQWAKLILISFVMSTSYASGIVEEAKKEMERYDQEELIDSTEVYDISSISLTGFESSPEGLEYSRSSGPLFLEFKIKEGRELSHEPSVFFNCPGNKSYELETYYDEKTKIYSADFEFSRQEVQNFKDSGTCRLEMIESNYLYKEGLIVKPLFAEDMPDISFTLSSKGIEFDLPRIIDFRLSKKRVVAGESLEVSFESVDETPYINEEMPEEIVIRNGKVHLECLGVHSVVPVAFTFRLPNKSLHKAVIKTHESSMPGKCIVKKITNVMDGFANIAEDFIPPESQATFTIVNRVTPEDIEPGEVFIPLQDYLDSVTAESQPKEEDAASPLESGGSLID